MNDKPNNDNRFRRTLYTRWVSVKYNGSIIKAKESIKVSKKCGADAIKFKRFP